MNVGKIEKLQHLSIGSEGENDAMDVVIDVSGWIDELVERGYENPCFHILFKPYGQSVPITCDTNTVYDRDEGTLTWTITEDVTQYAGLGYTEVRALNHPDNGLVKKSRVVPTVVDPSITGITGGTIPSPYNDWINTILVTIQNLNNALSNVSYKYAITDHYDDTPVYGDELQDISLNKGKFLWTRTIISWSTGTSTNLDNRSYIATDGEGAVDSVNGQVNAVLLDGRNLYRNIEDSPGSRVALNDAIDLKMDKENIIYIQNGDPPSGSWPVGKICLKKKT